MIESASLKRFISYAQTKFNDVESAAHRAMDRDHEWWPFGFLRPEPEEYLTSIRVALLACLYALPAALFTVVATRLAGDAQHALHLSRFLASVCLVFFMLYRFTFAYFWNRRAEQLQLLSARRISWKNGQGLR